MGTEWKPRLKTVLWFIMADKMANSDYSLCLSRGNRRIWNPEKSVDGIFSFIGPNVLFSWLACGNKWFEGSQLLKWGWSPCRKYASMRVGEQHRHQLGCIQNRMCATVDWQALFLIYTVFSSCDVQATSKVNRLNQDQELAAKDYHCKSDWIRK